MPPQINISILETDMYLTQQEFDISYYLYVILSMFSFVLATFVCATYYLFKNKFPSRLILCMAACVWLNHACAFFLLFGGSRLYTDEGLCLSQGKHSHCLVFVVTI